MGSGQHMSIPLHRGPESQFNKDNHGDRTHQATLYAKQYRNERSAKIGIKSLNHLQTVKKVWHKGPGTQAETK